MNQFIKIEDTALITIINETNLEKFQFFLSILMRFVFLYI